MFLLINQFQDKQTDYAADRELINFWMDRYASTGKYIGLQDISDGMKYIGLSDEDVDYIMKILKPGFDFNSYVFEPP